MVMCFWLIHSLIFLCLASSRLVFFYYNRVAGKFEVNFSLYLCERLCQGGDKKHIPSNSRGPCWASIHCYSQVLQSVQFLL